MLPDLLVPLADQSRRLTCSAISHSRANITALIISLLCGPAIRWPKTHQAEGQLIRDDGPESHLINKIGTPTMGGLLILIAFVVSTLLWMPLSNPYLWPVLLVVVAFGAIGSVDD